MSHIANTEELFRFASTRAPHPASRPAASFELADETDVPAWMAEADQQDFDAQIAMLAKQWRELTGIDPRAAYSELLANSQRATVLDLKVYFPTLPMLEFAGALERQLTALWKFYLQGVGSRKAGTEQLERCQEMIALASVLQEAAPGKTRDTALSPVQEVLNRKIRLPRAFEQSLQERHAQLTGQQGDAGRHLADTRDEAVRTQLAELDGLDQLARRLSGALEQFVPAASCGVLQTAASDEAAGLTHSVRPAEDVDDSFWRANAELLQDLHEASIVTAGLGVHQVFDSLRRLVADQVLAVSALPAGPAGAALIAGHPLLQGLAISAAPPAPASLAAVGRFGIRPIGIADLRVVRQVLVRYERGELAHIENVLQGEERERYFTRTQRVEEGQFDWNEREAETTRESQTSEFSTVSRDARAYLRESQDQSNSVSVSATYGEVSVSASTYMSNSRSLEQAIGEAVWRSRDVLNRTANTLRERAGRQRFRSALSEVQETIIQRQTGGTSNVLGQYRWVEKVYQVQVYNYGARAMYEIMLPKPAAMFTHLLAQTDRHGAVAGPAPVKPALRPADITESNWTWFAAQHGVSLPAPPPSAITEHAQAVFSSHDGAKPAASGVFRAAPGYVAAWAGCAISWAGAPGQAGVTASVGPRLFAASDNHGHPIAAQGMGALGGSVGFSTSGWGALQQYNVSVYLVRARTRAALEQWQQDCYRIVMDDYGARLAAYQDRAAAVINGENEKAPLTEARMRSIERTEIKRAVLEIVRSGTGRAAPQSSISLTGTPAIDASRVELAAREVRFFESAFEWDQMTYRFHPYFWNGAPADWEAGSLAEQGDSVFTAFLSAGFASVALPVRPGYEDAAALYLQTGLVLDLPVMPADDVLASMNHEVVQRNALQDQGVAEGEPWTYQVPTAMVVLDDGIHNRLPVLALEGNVSGA